ncbi:hypothetical protein [Paenibacillus piri]|uniref:Uncharacterized protein n=1 Tax=Paenibacillus piri TaxID=2547395 RepID=A0A4R5KGK6_9BACL|nr:hypothetical protein [Paenibacillus piri]TDF93828.1 hypothetical protein E1757_25945 [Paenibacillus piri]
MPPYFSVHYSFPYSSFTQDFVDEIYNTIFSYFPFKSGYWMSENNTLEEIISWNTSLLSKKFNLGFDQHVKHDYKQILLDSDLYSHLRLFWMYQSNEIILHLIVPEDDIFLDDELLRYNSSKLLPLLSLAVKIWNSFGVNTIQTYHELGAPTSYKKLLNGQQPSTEPFSILLPEAFSRFEEVLNDKFLVKKFIQGVLIIEKNYFDLVDTSILSQHLMGECND